MTDTATIRADFIKTFQTNIDQIKFELALIKNRSHKANDCVFVWPDNWLAVKISQGEVRAVGVAHATPVSSQDRRVFTNGNKAKAILMDREKALCGALVHAVSILDQFK